MDQGEGDDGEDDEDRDGNVDGEDRRNICTDLNNKESSDDDEEYDYSGDEEGVEGGLRRLLRSASSSAQKHQRAADDEITHGDNEDDGDENNDDDNEDDDDDDDAPWGYEELLNEGDDDDADESDEEQQQQQEEEEKLREQKEKEAAEKHNATLRTKIVREFLIEHGLLCRSSQHVSSLVREKTEAAADAVRLVPVLLHKLLKLQHETEEYTTAIKNLAETDRPPLFRLLARSINSGKVPDNHCSWEEMGDSLANK